MLLSPASTNAGLPGPNGFWNKFKPKNKEPDLRQQTAQMAMTRQRLLTLAFGEQETLHLLPSSFAELEEVARNWTKPPPDAIFSLRVPVEYASLHAARLVAGPYIYLTGEDSYQIAIMGVQGLRVEIVSDAPPPPDEPPAPPPPPVLDMPATFDLELLPGQHVALDVSVVSDELDMARMDDGTVVDGQFWGKLDIVHQGDTHKMEFSGTRLPPGEEYPADLLFDSRLISKLAVAAKPPVAKCQLSVICPAIQYCDITLQLSDHWSLGMTWPLTEKIDNRIKFFCRSHPGGALEHFESATLTTAFYYEIIPDPALIDPLHFLSPRNSFAMPMKDFISHLMGVLDQLGLSVHARTTFINNNVTGFSSHKNIAYRFLSPTKIAAAVDIELATENCVFTRLFLMWRGVNDEDMGMFVEAGEKEANAFNWREIIGWSEHMKDPTLLRLLEISIMELT